MGPVALNTVGESAEVIMFSDTAFWNAAAKLRFREAEPGKKSFMICWVKVAASGSPRRIAVAANWAALKLLYIVITGPANALLKA